MTKQWPPLVLAELLRIAADEIKSDSGKMNQIIRHNLFDGEECPRLSEILDEAAQAVAYLYGVYVGIAYLRSARQALTSSGRWEG